MIDQTSNIGKGMDTIGQIVSCLVVIATYNGQALALISRFTDSAPSLPDSIRVASIQTAFEALTSVNPQLADAVHDFVYEVTNPHSGVIVKNLAREHVARDVLGLQQV